MKFTKKGNKYTYEFDEKEEFVMFFLGTNPKMKNRQIKTVTKFVQHMSQSGILLAMGTIETWLQYFRNANSFEVEYQGKPKIPVNNEDPTQYIG